MSFRRKLLAMFALTVFLSVAAVTWVVSAITRRAFERSNEERTSALVAQFQREFNRRGQDVERQVQAVADSDLLTRMALAVGRGPADYSSYLDDARTAAETQQLDFLEFVNSEGTIVSSAQWPAKFGYKYAPLPAIENAPKQAFLKQEDLPDGAALALSAVRAVNVGGKPLHIIGGRRVDKEFLASLELPAGMRAFFYQNLGTGFSPQLLIGPASDPHNPERLSALIQQVLLRKQQSTEVVHWSSDAAEDETVHAIPMAGLDGQILGVLLIGNSRRPYVELSRHIGSAALLVGGASIVLAILLSGWAAGRVTLPVEQLAEAARKVAAGDWKTQVEITSADEIGQLAEAFNRMTHELLEQKEQLVQSERVAAWRELARRLAHELKNPLFPLQLTVENLVRARQHSPEQFDEVFQESASTLLAEIANLKAIISRFSEFSRMPQPQFQAVSLNDVLQNVARLFQAQLLSHGDSAMECKLALAEDMPLVMADAELLHRAISNLVLNAMDAMNSGGTLTLATHAEGDHAVVEVTDTGAGLTAEECERLFTPYYTSKAHGTGLGLAIVQSVISDHGGKISVRSEPGQGTTFRMEVPIHHATQPAGAGPPS